MAPEEFDGELWRRTLHQACRISPRFGHRTSICMALLTALLEHSQTAFAAAVVRNGGEVQETVQTLVDRCIEGILLTQNGYRLKPGSDEV